MPYPPVLPRSPPGSLEGPEVPPPGAASARYVTAGAGGTLAGGHPPVPGLGGLGPTPAPRGRQRELSSHRGAKGEENPLGSRWKCLSGLARAGGPGGCSGPSFPSSTITWRGAEPSRALSRPLPPAPSPAALPGVGREPRPRCQGGPAPVCGTGTSRPGRARGWPRTRAQHPGVTRTRSGCPELWPPSGRCRSGSCLGTGGSGLGTGGFPGRAAGGTEPGPALARHSCCWGASFRHGSVGLR